MVFRFISLHNKLGTTEYKAMTDAKDAGEWEGTKTCQKFCGATTSMIQGGTVGDMQAKDKPEEQEEVVAAGCLFIIVSIIISSDGHFLGINRPIAGNSITIIISPRPLLVLACWVFVFGILW